MTSLLNSVVAPFNLWDEPASPTNASQTGQVPECAVVLPPTPFVPSAITSCCTTSFATIPIPGADQQKKTARMLSRLADQQAMEHFRVDENSPRVTQLREFLLALGDEDQRFNFFALMRNEIRKLHIHDSDCRNSFPVRLFNQNLREGVDLVGLSDTDPDFVQQLFRSDIHYPEWPKAALKSVSTSPSSKRLHQLIAKLDLYNALGYDIFLCPNPLAFGVRSQRTVWRITIIVLEFDHNTLAQQLELLKQLKHVAVAAVYSGGKSVHVFIRLTCPIWNDRCPRSFNEVRQLRKSGALAGGIDIPAYDHLVKCWRYELLKVGFTPDRAVLGNFAGVVRVPGFKHALHARPSELLHRNPLARWNHQLAQHPDDWLEFVEGRTNWEIGSGFNQSGGSTTTLSYRPEGRAGSAGDLVELYSPPVTTMLHQLQPQEGLTRSDQGGGVDHGRQVFEVGGSGPAFPVTTVVQQTPLPDSKPVSASRAPTFLDDLNCLEELKRNGIPGRGQRRQLHRVLFTAARIHGWFDNEGRIAREWEVILNIAPANIGCTVNHGIRDILRDWRAVRRSPYKIWLPDCKKLPDLDQARRNDLLAGLTRLGCPKAIRSSTTNVIVTVLWPVIRTATIPCMEGRAAVQSRRLQAAAGERTRLVREWLAENNLLRLRDNHYEPGKRSRLFFINVPLAVWLMGFRTQDVTWSRQ